MQNEQGHRCAKGTNYLSLWIVISHSKYAAVTFIAAIQGIHCVLFVLQVQVLCGSHPVIQKKWSLFWFSAFASKTFGASVIILVCIPCSDICQDHTETPNISSVTVHWVGVTVLDEVFTSCDSSPVAHPWDCVELPSQIVTLSLISHPWDYGTNFAQSFFFPVNVINLPNQFVVNVQLFLY